jgi:hypothetical protein
MRNQIVLLFLVIVALGSPVVAQQAAGDSEFQLQGSITITDVGDLDNSGSVTATYGRFLTDLQEVGGTATGFFVREGKLAGWAGPFYRYNFSTSEIVPYVGGAAVATFGEFGSGDIELEFEGGVRFFLNRRTAFSVEGNTSYDVDEQELSDRLTIQFGFSFLTGNQ